MKHLFLALCLFAITPAFAQMDSIGIQTEEHAFKAKQLIAPAALIAAGAWGLAEQSPTEWLAHKAYRDMNPHRNHCKIDEYIQYVPGPVHLLLGFTGAKSKHNFRDRVLASATAHILMVGVTRAVKHSVREQRPDSEKRNSFFSGHTATAFTGAELMRLEYGWGYGAAAYAVAAGTGFLRLYNKRHWVGDVLTGAGVGILCADAGYWLLPVWKRLMKIDERDAARRAKKESTRTFVAAPFYQAEDHAAGVACNILF